MSAERDSEREGRENPNSQWASESTPIPEPTPILVSQLPKIIPFRDLCRCGDEVWIENDGQLYRLRRTRQGKLILTK